MNDALSILETNMSDPGSLKSGEYLFERVLKHAKQLIYTDKPGLCGALEA